MRLQGWLLLGMLASPTLVAAQTVKEADLIGGWQAEVELEGHTAPSRAWLVLWPDGLWWYGGPFMHHNHGGARWRLVGDTLWLGNDYVPYFHTMIDKRIMAIQAKGYGLAAMDMDVINKRPAFRVPDSVYWSKAFRDTTSVCAQGIPGKGGCGTWVYKVSKKDQQISLVRIESLSREIHVVASKAVLKRDTLLHCQWISGCK
jgi:hypothetical protein